jgi:FkbM family methyltransferase
MELRGNDRFADLRSVSNLRLGVVFDVGANIGQSFREFRRHYPGAAIYCFEPVAATFRQLTEAIGSDGNAHAFQVALAARAGDGRMKLEGSPDMFSFADNDYAGPSETVKLDTIDSFCTEHAIDRIGYLKIDTEGADLDVLKGARIALAEQRIDAIEVEAGLNPHNTRHVPLEQLKAHLERRDYLLFGIYEQFYEWPTGRPHLRRANLLFISKTVSDANRA